MTIRLSSLPTRRAMATLMLHFRTESFPNFGKASGQHQMLKMPFVIKSSKKGSGGWLLSRWDAQQFREIYIGMFCCNRTCAPCWTTQCDQPTEETKILDQSKSMQLHKTIHQSSLKWFKCCIRLVMHAPTRACMLQWNQSQSHVPSTSVP